MKSLNALQELIFPVRCLGCSALGLDICSSCRRSWHPHIYRKISSGRPYFPIYSAVQYSPIAAKVILAAKEDGILRAEKLMADALFHALSYCLQEQGNGFLVPIPSRANVSRTRGRQFIYELASQISNKSGIPTIENLHHVRTVKDQSSLDSRGRFTNLQGAMASMKKLNGRAILIDDLITTGATLNEAARALCANGIEVAAAVTACVANPLRLGG